MPNMQREAETLEQQLGKIMDVRRLKLAVAESCTGGLIADRLTNVAGSSSYFVGGVVAYSNDVKMGLLGVARETLAEHGAVSRETVIAMAIGVKNLLGADIAVSVSGIAGPGGAMQGKPVGTTWIGLSSLYGNEEEQHHFLGDRKSNKALAATAALALLIRHLLRNGPAN